MEIGAAALTAIAFIQRQGARGRRRVGGHPGEGTLLGVGNDGANRAQANALAGRRPQTGLNAARAGVALDQQGQDRPFERWRHGRCRRDRLEGLDQGLAPALDPGVEGLARDAEVTTELRDDAIVACLGDHLADDLSALLGCASMPLNHRVPPERWLIVDTSTIPFRVSFCNRLWPPLSSCLAPI
jgi:hypothetical protein